jgi:quinol monooxygenase YgiN
MLIVAGHFDADPAERDAFLAGRVDAIRSTRTEGGCLEYVMSADPVDPTRVMLFERWADQVAFDAHMAAIKTAPAPHRPGAKGLLREDLRHLR